MKRMVVLSTFICFAMICACQKQNSAAQAQLAQRTALDDPHEVTRLGHAVFIVGVEFLALGHDALIQRVRHAPAHRDYDRLGHLGRNHFAELLVLVLILLFRHRQPF